MESALISQLIHIAVSFKGTCGANVSAKMPIRRIAIAHSAMRSLVGKEQRPTGPTLGHLAERLTVCERAVCGDEEGRVSNVSVGRRSMSAAAEPNAAQVAI